MSTFDDKNILVTGGANGIGRLLGIKSMQEGAGRLFVWDIDEEAMHRLKEECDHNNWDCRTFRVDLRYADEIETAAETIRNQAGAIDMLFNNAGIVTGKKFQDHTVDDIEQTLAINTRAVMLTTRAFLPAMLKQDSGHIVNISSASAHIGNPNMSVYAASKWAVSGWSESLRLELEKAGSRVTITLVEPSYIKTGMFAGISAPVMTPLLEPEQIADKIIRAVKRNKLILRKPFMVKLLPFLKGILPARAFDLLAGRLFKVYSSMDTFKGKERGKDG